MTSTDEMHTQRTITNKGLLDTSVGHVAARKERRQRNRVMCEGLSCTLGKVIGLSGTGMRIRATGWCRIRQGDRISLTLKNSELLLKLNANIAWVKKVGLFQYEAGMAFVDLKPEQMSELSLMAQIAMPKMTLRRGTLPDLPTD